MSKDLMICDKSGDFCVSSSSSSTRVPFFRVSTFAPLHASIPDFNSGFRSSSVVGSPVVFSLLSRFWKRDFIDIYSMSDLEEVAFEFKEKKNRRIRVSTKYPNLTREFFYNKGVTQFSIVKSIGSTEIEPFTGGCELITDITSTGSTLAANNLRIINDGYILKSELCMFMGKTSFKNQGVKKLAKLLSTKY